MKKTIMLTGFICAVLVASQSFGQTKKTTSVKKTTTVKTTTTGPKASAADIVAGKQLLSKSDCLACHKVDEKFVGPAYKDVAAKYPANATNYALLTKKVIAGGSGVWGETPMSPHPQLAAADVRKMVTYILSLK